MRSPNRLNSSTPAETTGLSNLSGYALENAQAREEEFAGVLGETTANDIMINGRYGGREVGFDDAAKNGNAIAEDRASFAEIVARNPYLGDTIASRRVGGFHGTSSEALAGMLEQGSLRSTRAQLKYGQPIVSGEHGFQGLKGQGNISFSGLHGLESAFQYSGVARNNAEDLTGTEKLRSSMAEWLPLYRENAGNRAGNHTLRGLVGKQRQIRKLNQDPNSVAADFTNEPFPVMMGIDREFVRSTIPEDAKRNLGFGAGEMAEFRPFASEIPLAALPVVAVPSDRVESVAEIFKAQGYSGHEIVAIEDLIPESLMKDLPADRVEGLREAQQQSLSRSEQQAQQRFMRVRRVAGKMIDGMRRTRRSVKQDYEAPITNSWSELDATWVEAKAINQAALGLAMTQKALAEQQNRTSTNSLRYGDTVNTWGTAVENSAFSRATADSKKPQIAIPDLEINGAKLSVRDMNVVTTKSSDGEVGTILIFNCRQPNNNSNLTYNVRTDKDGMPSEVTVVRDGMSMKTDYRSSNIEALLHHVTAELHQPETAAV